MKISVLLNIMTEYLEEWDGIILTYDQDEDREYKELKISVRPVWKWLLEADMM